jgi:hypothetical protein
MTDKPEISTGHSQLTFGADMSIGAIILVVLVVCCIGSAPTWGYSSGWGWYGSGGLGLVVVILLVLLLMGRL